MLGCTRPQQQPQGTARRLARRTLMDRLSSATLFTSVNTVLEAFRCPAPVSTEAACNV